MRTLAKEIIDGRRLTRKDDLSILLSADLEELCAGADDIRKALCGNHMDLCSITNGRAGRCSENCKFCAQSAHHHTSCAEHGFLDTESFVKECDHASKQGVDRYSIVTAGRTIEGSDLEQAINAYETMHQKFPDMILCASHGLMKENDLKRLKDAGVTMYHANIETSKNYFPQICTTHTFADKLEEIRRAKAAGLEICSGGILGMGESWQDRIDMALQLSELQVDSIPLNFLIPIKGTPLENQPKLTTDEILRIVAIFRYINPTAYIRMAAGRSYFPNGGKALFTAGANATLTGDMLTTVGNNTQQDREMLYNLGFDLKERTS
jgi:biotin synthase